MQTGDDLSNITARLISETAVEAVKLSKEIAEETVKNTARAVSQGTYLVLKALLVKMMEHNKNLNPGKTNLGKLLKSEKELKMIDMKAEDLKHFVDKAKKFGICYAVVKDGINNHIVFKTEDTQRMEEVFKSTINSKLDGQKKDVIKSKKKNIVDKIIRKINPKGKVPDRLWKEKVPEQVWDEINKNRMEKINESNNKIHLNSNMKVVNIKNNKGKLLTRLNTKDLEALKKSNKEYTNRNVKVVPKRVKTSKLSTVLNKKDIDFLNSIKEEMKTDVNFILKSIKENKNPSIRDNLNRLSKSPRTRTTQRTRKKRQWGRKR